MYQSTCADYVIKIEFPQQIKEDRFPRVESFAGNFRRVIVVADFGEFLPLLILDRSFPLFFFLFRDARYVRTCARRRGTIFATTNRERRA